MNPSMNFVPAFQQGGGPGYEHMAPAKAAAAAHGGAREHRFSPYVDNGGYDTLRATQREASNVCLSWLFMCVLSLSLCIRAGRRWRLLGRITVWWLRIPA